MKVYTKIVAATLIVAVCESEGLTAGDNFNDNSFDSLKWTAILQDNAAFTETNQRLEYTSPAGGFFDGGGSVLEWNAGGLSYAEDWSVAVELGSLLAPAAVGEGFYGLDLDVGYQDLLFRIELFVQNFSPGRELVTIIDDQAGFIVTDIVDPGASQFTVRIEFNSTAKTLASFYNTGSGYVVMTNYSVAGWGMTASSTFTPGISAVNAYVPINAGQVFFDDFVITTPGGGVSDADNDDMLDTWEVQYFGSTSVLPSGHGDSDTLDNLSEYIAGTNPTNGASVFEVSDSGASPSGYVLNWNAVEGRTYGVKWSDSLTNSFTVLTNGIAYPQNSYTDSVHSVGNSGYYSISVTMESGSSGGEVNVAATWLDTADGTPLIFNADGTMLIDASGSGGAVWSGTYSVTGNVVSFTATYYDSGTGNTVTLTADASVSGNTMSGDMVFSVQGTAVDTDTFSATRQ